jgi:hypothetical protein
MWSRASTIDWNHDTLGHSARIRAFNAWIQAIVRWLSGQWEFGRDSIQLGPLVEHPTGELWRPLSARRLFNLLPDRASQSRTSTTWNAREFVFKAITSHL